MAASNPAGGNKFWFNGIPFTGVAKSGTITTGIKYWFNGIPLDTLIPASASSQTYAAFGTPQLDGQSIVDMMEY